MVRDLISVHWHWKAALRGTRKTLQSLEVSLWILWKGSPLFEMCWFCMGNVYWKNNGDSFSFSYLFIYTYTHEGSTSNAQVFELRRWRPGLFCWAWDGFSQSSMMRTTAVTLQNNKYKSRSIRSRAMFWCKVCLNFGHGQINSNALFSYIAIRTR